MTETELEELLSRPTPGAIEVLRHLPGDLLILGAGGKMGARPSKERLPEAAKRHDRNDRDDAVPRGPRRAVSPSAR